MSNTENEKPIASPLEVLRAATVGQRVVYRTRAVKLPGGADVELREVSERKRRVILNRAKARTHADPDGGASVTMDVAELRVWCVIEMCYVPGTDTQVFSAADYDALMNQPPQRGWYAKLADEAWVLFSVADEDLDPGKSEEEKTES